MKFISMEQADDGDLAIQYIPSEGQSEMVQETRTIYITTRDLSEWEHAAYYYVEMMQDIDEFMGWVDKYRRGVAE